MSGHRVAVLVCTTFFVVSSSILLVSCRRSGTFSTGVVAVGAACPAVVVRGATGGLDTCSAELLSEVGDGNMKLREVLQGDEELGVGDRVVCGDCAVGCSESCYRGAITGRGRREIRDGFDRFVLVGVVGRLIGVVAQLENGAGCGRLRLPPFLLGSGKKFLEVGPGLDGWRCHSLQLSFKRPVWNTSWKAIPTTWARV